MGGELQWCQWLCQCLRRRGQAMAPALLRPCSGAERPQSQRAQWWCGPGGRISSVVAVRCQKVQRSPSRSSERTNAEAGGRVNARDLALASLAWGSRSPCPVLARPGHAHWSAPRGIGQSHRRRGLVDWAGLRRRWCQCAWGKRNVPGQLPGGQQPVLRATRALAAALWSQPPAS